MNASDTATETVGGRKEHSAPSARLDAAAFRDLFDALSAGVVLQDAEDRILLANRAAQRILGIRLDDVLGVTSRDPRWRLVREDGEPLEVEDVPSVRAARTGEPCTDVVLGSVHVETGERRWLQVSATPRKDDAGVVVATLVTLIDVTAVKRAEEERRRAEEDLRRAQRMESLGALAGGVAHDFGNLLTALNAHVEAAAAEARPGSALADHVAALGELAERATELIRQLLTYAGRGLVARRRCGLETLVGDLRAYCAAAAPPGAAVRLELDAAPVEADAVQVRQIVMNLFTNAAEALPAGGGTIVVSTGTADVDAEELRSPFLPDAPPAGRYAFLDVEDDGCGMAPDVLSRMFDPFFTTKPTGRGVGLASVLGVVRAHGGALRVRSTPGVGTAVRLYLPAAE